jgi:hypothetical protein
MKQKMKYILPGLALALFATFSDFVSMAQVTVQVPSTCDVVVAGIGGTTGYGQYVGDGGIVTMPDPYAGGTFTYFPGCCAGPLPASWYLQGDLSITQTAVPPSPALQVAGAVGTLPIMSYNENLVLPFEADMAGFQNARNLGKVNVGYNLTGPCSFIDLGISFKIYKVYSGSVLGSGGTYIAPIIGPTCVEAGNAYVYSQAPDYSGNEFDAIGIDTVRWAITIPVTGDYYSGDHSSYTFTTPASLVGLPQPFVLTVCDGGANPWDGFAPAYVPGTTCVSTNIYAIPTMPVWTVPPPSCLPTGMTAYSISYNTDPLLTYTWTSSDGEWALNTVTGVGTQTLNITDMDDNPSTLTLTITGPCPPVTFTFTINRTFIAPTTYISGPSCVIAGTANTFQIASGADVLGNCTNWTLPPGWPLPTYLDGDGSIISINVPSWATGSYILSASECFCPGTISTTIYITPSAPTIVSGPPCVDRITPGTATYTASIVAGAISYTWYPPLGWTPAGPITTAGPISPTFTAGGCSPGPDAITVVANGPGGCSSPASAPYIINYDPITPTGITYGCYSSIPGTMTISVTPAICGFYGSWTLTTIPAGFFPGYSWDPITGEITVITTGVAGQPQICLTHNTTACGSGPTICFPPVKLGPSAWVDAYCNPSATGSDLYVCYGAPSGSTYSWSEVGYGFLTSGSNVLVCSMSGTVYGDFCVTITSGTCTIGPICVPPCTHSYYRESEDSSGGPKKPVNKIQVYSDDIKVNPNPNPGTFKVDLPKFNSGAIGKLIAADGKEAGNYNLNEGENYISNEGLAPGIYYFILNVDGNVSSYKIEILKQ